MAKEKERFSNTINIRNKRASFEFEFIDTYIAGIQLKGSEIKSIREGKVNISDAHCYFSRGELFVKNFHISPYSNQSFNPPEPMRERKLLLTKKELKKLESKSEEKGLTIVPIRLFINQRGFAKLEIALARGKKIHDKRDSIKDRDVKRELDRIKF
jgi:SsrA-binding protein